MSKYIYDELVAAGAPELPYGYFYQLKEDPYLDLVHISIRRKKGGFNFLEAEQGFWYDEVFKEFRSISDMRDWYADKMQEVYARWCSMSYSQDQWKTFRSFMGDHP